MLYNPCDPSDQTRNFLFTVYAIQTQKKEDVINALAREENPNDYKVQSLICERYGLNLNYLSEDELSYIEREVAKRWHGK